MHHYASLLHLRNASRCCTPETMHCVGHSAAPFAFNRLCRASRRLLRMECARSTTNAAKAQRYDDHALPISRVLKPEEFASPCRENRSSGAQDRCIIA